MLKVNSTIQPARHGGVIYHHTGWSPSTVRACGYDGPSCHQLRALGYSTLERGGWRGPCPDVQPTPYSSGILQVFSLQPGEVLHTNFIS